jgi:serralysin
MLSVEVTKSSALIAPEMPYGPMRSLAWGTQLSDDIVTVHFVHQGESRDGYSSDGFNAYEKAQFVKAFDMIAAVANLRFVITSDPDADFQLLLNTTEMNQNVLGYFNPPGELGAGSGVFNGSAWDREAGGNLERGGEGYATIVHELLHGLGLAHPHDRGGTSNVMSGVNSDFNDYGHAKLNQGIFTAMSYNGGYQSGSAQQRPLPDAGYEAGPMALDIAVLQALYGANTETYSGRSIYVLPDGYSNAPLEWRCIWDTGGTDIIAYHGSNDTSIDLRAATLWTEPGGGGFLSAVVGVPGGFTIARGVQIEDAIGGSGDDALRGNDLGNVLTGRGGTDRLVGLNGNDILRGGSEADVMYGGNGRDRMSGDGGRDKMYGGNGDDRLYGSSGSDLLIGNAGADELIGGTGADDFIYSRATDSQSGSGNVDHILDMDTGQDRIWLRNIDADLTRSGNQAFDFIGHAGFTGAGQLRLIESRGDTYVQMDLNGDRRADIAIVLDDATGLLASDFVL